MDEYFNQLTTKNQSSSYNNLAQFLVVLLIAKFLKSIGIYLCYDLLKHIHIVQLLFFALLIASLVFVLLQKPFDKRLNKSVYWRILKFSFVHTLIKVFWLFGLTQCGPLRTSLIFEQSEVVVLCALKAVFLSQTNPSRTRGVVILLIATLLLLAFDYDDLEFKNTNTVDHPEGMHHGIISHIFYFFISFFDVSDHKAGVILLVGALFLHSGFNQSSLSKTLVSDVGGQKRLRALSACFSVVILAPWAIFNLFTSSLDPSSYSTFSMDNLDIESISIEQTHSWYYYLIPVVLMSVFVFVFDFYVESYVSQKTDQVYTAKYGAIFIFTASIGLSFIWNHPHVVKVTVMDKIKNVIEQEHALSWGVIFAYFLYVLATNMLSKPLSKHKGSFIGYSSVGNPLYSLTGETLKRTSMSMFTIIKNILREIVSHTDSRRIFYFLCVNLAFTFVELIYGAFSNSLGLISDGVHMLFDCSALVMGLFAAVVSQWKPTRIYSYGFGRLEILSGFINGLFLVVISLFVFIEGVTRLFEPPEIKSGKLIYVSIAGLCVNLFGIVVFGHAHSHGGGMGGGDDHNHHGHSHGGGGNHNHTHSHSHSHDHSHSSSSVNDNMRGVYLHVLADTLGSVGVITSSFLIQTFGWYVADPLCSICIAIMIFVSVIPLLKHSSSLLLLRTPTEKEKLYNLLLQRILCVDGVISYRDDHLWQLSPNTFVATLHVQINPNAYEQLISSQIHGILKELKLTSLTVQIEKEFFFQHLSGLGANMGQIDTSRIVQRSNENNLAQNTLINFEKFV